MGIKDEGSSRREFIKQASAITALGLVPTTIQAGVEPTPGTQWSFKKITLEVNGKVEQLKVDPRMSLLDLLREQLHLTGAKKGCDQGHCGACIVHVNGKRVNSCTTTAIDISGSKVTTIEGLSNGDDLHPMQQAFIKHDAFQCGYCTSGQIMSAVACVKEGHAGSVDEIRDYMNDNICRCGAYPNIVDAILDAKQSGKII